MTAAARFEPNSIAHFDVAGPNFEQLSAFYEKVLGWRSTARGPGYSQLETPTIAGALVHTEQASLTIGIVVDDLDRVLRQATEAGGRVEMPAMDNGWVKKAKMRDPAGNVLTLIQNGS